MVTTLSALLAMRPDVMVEVAGHEGVREHAAAVLRAGIDLVMISVGALADARLFDELVAAAHMGGSHLRVASGAIGGLDALAAASLGGLRQVIHTMRKPPETLLKPEEAATLTAAREIFRGSARQADQQFPEFLNVAAAVALAGSGFDRTGVRVLADPGTRSTPKEHSARFALRSSMSRSVCPLAALDW